jgi:hypothetical protein
MNIKVVQAKSLRCASIRREMAFSRRKNVQKRAKMRTKHDQVAFRAHKMHPA